jgi:tetratricopeptide (TPR) repeat protein
MMQNTKYKFKIAIVCLMLGFLFPGNGHAEANTEKQFAEANELYRNKKFSESAVLYEKTAQEKPAANVYFNLGNAYFKSGKVGLSILNYERARKLAPRDPDIAANLDFAKRTIEYEIKNKENWYIKQVRSFLKGTTFDECWLLALGAYLFFIVFFLINIFGRGKPILGRATFNMLLLLLLCSLPLMLKYSQLGTRNHAIVTEPEAEVRYGPSINDRLAFRLVEGLRVTVKGAKDDWYQIELDNEHMGWIPKSDITVI